MLKPAFIVEHDHRGNDTAGLCDLVRKPSRILGDGHATRLQLAALRPPGLRASFDFEERLVLMVLELMAGIRGGPNACELGNGDVDALDDLRRFEVLPTRPPRDWSCGHCVVDADPSPLRRGDQRRPCGEPSGVAKGGTDDRESAPGPTSSQELSGLASAEITKRSPTKSRFPQWLSHIGGSVRAGLRLIEFRRTPEVIESGREQGFVLPPDVTAWLPANHLAWLVNRERQDQSTPSVVRRRAVRPLSDLTAKGRTREDQCRRRQIT